MADKTPQETKALMEAAGLKPDRHNWMYSFMSGTSNAGSSVYIYLVGYCKQCDQTFSRYVPTGYSSSEVSLSRAGVPKLGCDWAGE